MWLAYVEYHLRPLPGFTLLQPALESLALREWRRTRRPPPPRTIKAAMIRDGASDTRRVFVETGTFFGDMLAAVRDDFERLYSIELSTRLAAHARRRFARDPRISLLQGDSGTLLGPTVRSVAAPAVLWLDGHYSGWLTARGDTDTPLGLEVAAALEAGTPDDLMLVDDARLLDSDAAYPKRAELEEMIRRRRPDWSVTLENDVLRAGRA